MSPRVLVAMARPGRRDAPRPNLSRHRDRRLTFTGEAAVGCKETRAIRPVGEQRPGGQRPPTRFTCHDVRDEQTPRGLTRSRQTIRCFAPLALRLSPISPAHVARAPCDRVISVAWRRRAGEWNPPATSRAPDDVLQVVLRAPGYSSPSFTRHTDTRENAITTDTHKTSDTVGQAIVLAAARTHARRYRGRPADRLATRLYYAFMRRNGTDRRRGREEGIKRSA